MNSKTLQGEILKAAHAEFLQTGVMYSNIFSDSVAETLGVPPQDVYREVGLLSQLGLVKDLGHGHVFVPTARGIEHARRNLGADEGGSAPTDPPSFPPPDRPSLFPLDVRDYLVDKRGEGWDVRQEGGKYIIQVNPMCQVILTPQESGVCGVSTEYASGISSSGGRATNLFQLQAMVEPTVGAISGSSVLLKRGKPAANEVSIARLIGSATVEAFHDPHLNNKGLSTLLSILSLSNGASRGLRLMTRRMPGKDLTLDLIESCFTDLECSAGEMRQSSDPKAHRRFFLLSGGMSIHLGPSANQVSKNEAATRHPDSADRDFFDQEWAKGKQIYPYPVP